MLGWEDKKWNVDLVTTLTLVWGANWRLLPAHYELIARCQTRNLSFVVFPLKTYVTTLITFKFTYSTYWYVQKGSTCRGGWVGSGLANEAYTFCVSSIETPTLRHDKQLSPSNSRVSDRPGEKPGERNHVFKPINIKRSTKMYLIQLRL